MSTLSTHILDTARGLPAEELCVALYRAEDENCASGTLSEGAVQWQLIAEGVSNSDGRVPDLLPDESRLESGRYRMHFATEAYLRRRGVPVFYPCVDVVFDLPTGDEHFHIPLLLSPFGFSTYRGS